MENNRAQLEEPLDEYSKGTLRRALELIFGSFIKRSDRFSLTLAAAATSFAIQSNYMVLTGDPAGNTVAKITGGREGMVLVLEFTDAKITLTDDGSGNTDTINLSAAFTSTADDTMQLIYSGKSWRELSRSVN